MKTGIISGLLTICVKLALFTAIFSVSSVNAATAHHSLEDIKTTAREFVLSTLPNQEIEFKVVAERLDPRLRLNACGKPLQAWYPGKGRRAGNVTVGIRCDDESPWSIYVSVKVNYYQEIVVASHPLQRGAIITRDDVRLEKKNLSFYAGKYFTDPDEVIGQELVHSLQMGYIIKDRNLKLPVIVKRGQQVTLLAQNDTYEVRMDGKAMMDGAAGQRIKVRNTRSKRIVEGIVKSNRIIYIE